MHAMVRAPLRGALTWDFFGVSWFLGIFWGSYTYHGSYVEACQKLKGTCHCAFSLCIPIPNLLSNMPHYDYFLFALLDNNNQGICLDRFTGTIYDADDYFKKWDYLTSDLFEEGLTFPETELDVLKSEIHKELPRQNNCRRFIKETCYIPKDAMFGEYAGVSYSHYLFIRRIAKTSTHTDPYDYYYVATDVSYAFVPGGGENITIDAYNGDEDITYFKEKYMFHSSIVTNYNNAGCAYASVRDTIPNNEKFKHLVGEIYRCSILLRICKQ